jgi:glycosyltransferase involved in cell wall biosynthesis
MDINYKKGIKLLEGKKYSEARLLFLDELEKEQNNIKLITALANAEYKLGAGFRAELLLNAALVLDPENKQVEDFLKIVTKRPSTSKKGKLGISMIVRDEEKNLPKALESIKEIADEIVINDTGSKDKTIEIAQKYGAKVIQSEWDNDYAEARNIALRHNEAEWILYIDADERLSDNSKDEIIKLVQKSDETIGAYVCNIISKHQTNIEPKKYEGRYPRLFKNYGTPFVFFFGKIHEQISPFILDLGKKIRNSEIEIIHDGYDIPQEKMNEKVKRNLNILLDHTKKEPENELAWYQLGMTFAQMQLNDEALKILEHALKLNKLTGYLLSNTQLTLASIYMKKKDFNKAVKYSHD